MKKLYFVMDLKHKKNDLHYPVVCVVYDGEPCADRIKKWAGPDHNIVNYCICDTKKRAREICESMRDNYKKQNMLEFMQF